jgi:ATP-dependent DNA ligase
MIVHSRKFVIGGFTIGARTFDALIFGYYVGGRLLYAGRTRSGYTPAVRGKLQQAFRGLEIPECPFANLPEAHSGRWGLTAEKIKECRWLRRRWSPSSSLSNGRRTAISGM